MQHKIRMQLAIVLVDVRGTDDASYYNPEGKDGFQA